MKTMYRACTLGSPSVETIEVERETDLSVWVKNRSAGSRRQAKEGNYNTYFDTFDEAKQHCINWCVGKVDKAQSRLNHEQDQLNKFLPFAECDVKSGR